MVLGLMNDLLIDVQTWWVKVFTKLGSCCTKISAVNPHLYYKLGCSSSPGGAVEVGVLELLPDLLQKVPAGSAISNMVGGRAAFVVARVELPNDVSFAVLRMQHEGA